MKVILELNIDPGYCKDSLGFTQSAPIEDVVKEAMEELFNEQWDRAEGVLPSLLSGSFEIKEVFDE